MPGEARLWRGLQSAVGEPLHGGLKSAPQLAATPPYTTTKYYTAAVSAVLAKRGATRSSLVPWPHE